LLLALRSRSDMQISNKALLKTGAYIDGKWVDSDGGAT
jgi:hypothetical protein